MKRVKSEERETVVSEKDSDHESTHSDSSEDADAMKIRVIFRKPKLEGDQDELSAAGTAKADAYEYHYGRLGVALIAVLLIIVGTLYLINSLISSESLPTSSDERTLSAPE
ncbi:MAG: hypothetical protein P8144_01800, partial [Gammaproteobacteria bacterium]